jgi:hypothetical protein
MLLNFFTPRPLLMPWSTHFKIYWWYILGHLPWASLWMPNCKWCKVCWWWVHTLWRYSFAIYLMLCWEKLFPLGMSTVTVKRNGSHRTLAIYSCLCLRFFGMSASGVGRCQINNGGCWKETRNGKSVSACSVRSSLSDVFLTVFLWLLCLVQNWLWKFTEWSS